MEEFEEQLWFRDLESVSAEYEELEIPPWLTEAKGQQIITEMELYEQKEWVKIIRDQKEPNSKINLRILRYRTQDQLAKKYKIEVEHLHRVALTTRSISDVLKDHQISKFLNERSSEIDEEEKELEDLANRISKTADKRDSQKIRDHEGTVDMGKKPGRRTVKLEKYKCTDMPRIIEEDNESMSAASSRYSRYRASLRAMQKKHSSSSRSQYPAY